MPPHPLGERGPGGERQRAAALFVHLAQTAAAPAGLALTHPYSPFGVVELAPGCTGCGVCAQSCPTRALVLRRQQDGVTLTFDSALCTACGQCLARCTEAERQVLHLRRVTDLQKLAQGRTTLYRDEVRHCEACGRAIAPQALLQQVAARLGDAHANTSRLIRRYCASCRSAGVVNLSQSE